MRTSPDPAAATRISSAGGDEQLLVAVLARPPELPSGQGVLELGPIVVAQAVEQRRVAAAQCAERFEHRRVGPGALHRRGGPSGHLPALPAGQRVGQVEDRRLPHSGRTRDQQRDAPSRARLLEDGADAGRPRCAARRDGAGAALCRRWRRRRARSLAAAALRSSSARSRTASGAGRGTELPVQRLLEPFELDQGTTDVAAGGTRPGQGQVRAPRRRAPRPARRPIGPGVAAGPGAAGGLTCGPRRSTASRGPRAAAGRRTTPRPRRRAPRRRSEGPAGPPRVNSWTSTSTSSRPGNSPTSSCRRTTASGSSSARRA